MKILEQKNNDLLKRKEIKAELSFEGATPNRDTIKSQLNQKGHVVIRTIKTNYGENNVIVTAMVYESKDQAEKVESEHVKKKNFKEKPKPEAEEKKAEE